MYSPASTFVRPDNVSTYSPSCSKLYVKLVVPVAAKLAGVFVLWCAAASYVYWLSSSILMVNAAAFGVTVSFPFTTVML